MYFYVSNKQQTPIKNWHLCVLTILYVAFSLMFKYLAAKASDALLLKGEGRVRCENPVVSLIGKKKEAQQIPVSRKRHKFSQPLCVLVLGGSRLA